MSTQPFSDNVAYKIFFLNLGDAQKSSAAGKWHRSNRLAFCAASAIASWMIFVRVGELLVG